ncbi:hypothetical protein A8F94_03835 [Bacillus sp. FJAT-27225]|uniref:YfjL-like protein n=1 Tax=Bacillus sp. FJAT-27225 TaxID=1743144 RepID=UPI00080C29A6|nr:hypothetical protein [Bacillus sp. FJAT-27225]OCA91006.1 hypothetical protein A8F94_03835 [Bacillus sp. FJAT-27225]
MKLKTKSILLLVSLALLAGGLFLYGNPIGRADSKRIAEKHLQKKHPSHSIEINDIGYYPGEGTYIVHYNLNDGEREGNLDIRKGKVINNE